MKLGIIGAMAVEVDSLINKVNIVYIDEIGDLVFYSGNIGNVEVVIAKSGVGKVNAAICATHLIYRYNCTVILNTGIAGALDPYLKILDTVVCLNAAYHDVDCTKFGYDLGVIPQSKMDSPYYPADPSLTALVADLISDIHIGNIVSGDQFISDTDKKKQIFKEFKEDVSAVDMESAAIAQACTLADTPFVIVRTISDNADDNAATMDYNEFEKMAAEKSVDIVIKFCELISK